MMIDYINIVQDISGGTLFAYVSLFVGAAVGIAIALINKRKFSGQGTAYENLKKEVRQLRLALAEERKMRGIVEARWESLKLSFHILYNQYEIEFEGDHDKMGMLKDLKKLFDL